jgi:hypothetical protein
VRLTRGLTRRASSVSDHAEPVDFLLTKDCCLPCTWRAGDDEPSHVILTFSASCQENARKLFRRRSGSPLGTSASISQCVRCQTGTARTSRLRPFAVRVVRRLRRSLASAVTLTRPRRCNGFRAAVKVVRSIASSDATAPIPGGSGRFKDIISENCPLVTPRGRRASSKRRASALAARWT